MVCAQIVCRSVLLHATDHYIVHLIFNETLEKGDITCVSYLIYFMGTWTLNLIRKCDLYLLSPARRTAIAFQYPAAWEVIRALWRRDWWCLSVSASDRLQTLLKYWHYNLGIYLYTHTRTHPVTGSNNFLIWIRSYMYRSVLTPNKPPSKVFLALFLSLGPRVNELSGSLYRFGYVYLWLCRANLQNDDHIHPLTIAMHGQPWLALFTSSDVFLPVFHPP